MIYSPFLSKNSSETLYATTSFFQGSTCEKAFKEIEVEQTIIIREILISKGINSNNDLITLLLSESMKTIRAITFFTIESIWLSRETFKTVYTFLFLPSVNFHPSHRFHRILKIIFDLIAEIIPDVSILRPLVKRLKSHFCSDMLHFSKIGMGRNLVMFNNFLDIVGRHCSSKVPNFQSIATNYNEKSLYLDRVQHLKQEVVDAYQHRNYPFKNKKHKQAFERKHYRFMNSSKPMAISTDKRRMRVYEGLLSSKFDKLFVMHTDSLWRDLCSSDIQIKKLFINKKGCFRFPNIFTISPGSTAYDLSKEFYSKSFDEISFSALISIHALGTNEILQLFSQIDSILCDLNLIKPACCSVCKRFNLNQNFVKKKYVHGRPEITKTFNFLTLV